MQSQGNHLINNNQIGVNEKEIKKQDKFAY